MKNYFTKMTDLTEVNGLLKCFSEKNNCISEENLLL